MKRIGISLFGEGKGRINPPENRTRISGCHLFVGGSESTPTKVPKTAAYGIGNARFVIEAFFVAEVHFADTGNPKRYRVNIKMLLSPV